MVAEGINTTRSVHDRATKMMISMPITQQVYRVLFEDKDPRAAVTDLMLREVGHYAKDEVTRGLRSTSATRLGQEGVYMELAVAFKEWAVICRALAEGKQSLILRKGGIAEEGGEFTVEHTRAFGLYPTYTHQQRDGIKPEPLPMLKATRKRKNHTTGVVRLSHWAEVTGVYRVRDLLLALMLPHLHFWSEEAIRKRFSPIASFRASTWCWTVRVYQAPQIHEIVETPASMGCKSWVEMDEPQSTAGSKPVLTDAEYHDVSKQLGLLLKSRGLGLIWRAGSVSDRVHSQIL